LVLIILQKILSCATDFQRFFSVIYYKYRTMLYRTARWKRERQDIQSFKQGLVSLSRRRKFTKRPVKVDVPVPRKALIEKVFWCTTVLRHIETTNSIVTYKVFNTYEIIIIFL